MLKWNYCNYTLGHRRSLGGGRGGHCPPRSEPIDFVRSINTKIFSHCLILFALSYFNEYVKAKLFIINVKKKNLRDEKNQKLAPICDVSGQIFRSFHTAHRNDLTANLSGEKIVDIYANRKRGGFFYIR